MIDLCGGACACPLRVGAATREDPLASSYNGRPPFLAPTSKRAVRTCTHTCTPPHKSLHGLPTHTLGRSFARPARTRGHVQEQRVLGACAVPWPQAAAREPVRQRGHVRIVDVEPVLVLSWGQGGVQGGWGGLAGVRACLSCRAAATWVRATAHAHSPPLPCVRRCARAGLRPPSLPPPCCPAPAASSPPSSPSSR